MCYPWVGSWFSRTHNDAPLYVIGSSPTPDLHSYHLLLSSFQHHSSSSNSSAAVLKSTAGLGSDSGTKANLPGGFTTYSPRTSANFFLPIIFSNSVRVRSSCL